MIDGWKSSEGKRQRGQHVYQMCLSAGPGVHKAARTKRALQTETERERKREGDGGGAGGERRGKRNRGDTAWGTHTGGRDGDVKMKEIEKGRKTKRDRGSSV